MPWLVVYIGLLFPVMLLLVVLAMDWQRRQSERQGAAGLPEPGTVAQGDVPVECPRSAHGWSSWWKAS